MMGGVEITLRSPGESDRDAHRGQRRELEDLRREERRELKEHRKQQRALDRSRDR